MAFLKFIRSKVRLERARSTSGEEEGLPTISVRVLTSNPVGGHVFNPELSHRLERQVGIVDHGESTTVVDMSVNSTLFQTRHDLEPLKRR